MWSRPRAPWPITLAGQFLALQLVVLLLVLAVTSVVSVRQSDADFRDTRGARLRAAAENLASTPVVAADDRRSRPTAVARVYTERTQRSAPTPAPSTSPSRDGTVVARPTRRPVDGDRIDLGDEQRAASGGRGPVTSTTAGTARSPPRCP